MKDKCKIIYDELFIKYGKVDCPLEYSSNFQLMIAVMLSAQCTDIAVNKVTPILFNKFPNSELMAKAELEEVEEIIKPLGLYHAKAKNIIASSQYLQENFEGIVPDNIETLVKFPGIGRKTANVIVTHAFNLPGFAVDTHVKRILNRIGIVNSEDPVKIEMFVRKKLSLEKLGNFSLLLITHGRQCCKARNPVCPNCIIREKCSYFKNNV